MIIKHDYLSKNNLKFNFKLNIKEFSLYSLFIIKCPQKETENVEITINGIIELMNPFGYLQSESIGYYPVTMKFIKNFFNKNYASFMEF